jgi:hypothetical protein
LIILCFGEEHRNALDGLACWRCWRSSLRGIGRAQDINWQEAVARMAQERTLAETCAALLKKYGDAGAVDRGALAYADAKSEYDAIITGLDVALARGAQPPLPACRTWRHGYSAASISVRRSAVASSHWRRRQRLARGARSRMWSAARSGRSSMRSRRSGCGRGMTMR